MKSRVLFIIIVILFTNVISGEQTSIRLEKELQIAENQVKDVLRKFGNEVSFKYLDSKAFEISYRTRKFMVHSGSMIGRFSEKASERTGPDYDGFILWINLQDAGVVNQASTPQIIREPYWYAYLDVTLISGTTKQIYWGLSYWNRLDENILSQIKEAIWKLDKSSNKISSNTLESVNQPPVRKSDELTGIFKKNMKSLSPYRLEIDGGDSINLRGSILESVPDNIRIWVTGNIHSIFYNNSTDPSPAMPSHQWHIFMNVESYKKISNPYEIPKPD